MPYTALSITATAILAVVFSLYFFIKKKEGAAMSIRTKLSLRDFEFKEGGGETDNRAVSDVIRLHRLCNSLLVTLMR